MDWLTNLASFLLTFNYPIWNISCFFCKEKNFYFIVEFQPFRRLSWLLIKFFWQHGWIRRVHIDTNALYKFSLFWFSVNSGPRYRLGIYLIIAVSEHLRTRPSNWMHSETPSESLHREIVKRKELNSSHRAGLICRYLLISGLFWTWKDKILEIILIPVIGKMFHHRMRFSFIASIVILLLHIWPAWCIVSDRGMHGFFIKCLCVSETLNLHVNEISNA